MKEKPLREKSLGYALEFVRSWPLGTVGVDKLLAIAKEIEKYLSSQD